MGNLEVFSLAAFETLAANVDTCKASVPWKVGVKGGKWGPMGEDLFAQQCLDSLGVPRVEQYDISTDGACEADRPEGRGSAGAAGQRDPRGWLCLGPSSV